MSWVQSLQVGLFSSSVLLVGFATACGDGGGSDGRDLEDNLSGPPPPGLTIDSEGWSEVMPSEAYRIYYVSSSEGADDDTGTEMAPFATIAKGLEEMGPGDALLLKRGDVFEETIAFWRNGESAEHRTLIGAYGDEDDPRPVIDPMGGVGFQATGGGNRPDTLEHLALVSLHFRSSVPGGAAIRVLRPGNDVLFEDLFVEGFGTNIIIQDDTREQGIHNVVVRRSIIVDAYSADDEHSQGIYMAYVHNPLIEENVFDHNGYNEAVSGAIPTKFNHNVYIQSTCVNPILRNNIIARGSSHGFQLRPSGIAEGNIVIANAIAGFVATDNMQDDSSVVLNDNVVLHGSRAPIGPSEDQSTLGWGLEIISAAAHYRPAAARVEFQGNIIAHGDPGARFAEKVSDQFPDVVPENVVYDWGDDRSDPGPFKDPDRTLATYQVDVLKEDDPSIESFMRGARSMRKPYWLEEYSAKAMREYFVDGFSPP